MDQLVQLHGSFLSQVNRFCMLDPTNKYMRRELGNVLSTVLEFRKIVKKYLLSHRASSGDKSNSFVTNSVAADSDDSESDEDAHMEESDHS